MDEQAVGERETDGTNDGLLDRRQGRWLETESDTETLLRRSHNTNNVSQLKTFISNFITNDIGFVSNL